MVRRLFVLVVAALALGACAAGGTRASSTTEGAGGGGGASSASSASVSPSGSSSSPGPVCVSDLEGACEAYCAASFGLGCVADAAECAADCLNAHPQDPCMLDCLAATMTDCQTISPQCAPP